VDGRTRLVSPAALCALVFTASGVGLADPLAIRFNEIGSQTGVVNTWVGYGFGAGVAAEDVDNDGDPDILILNSLDVSNRLFENVGDAQGLGRPTFVEVTGDAGLGDLGNTKSAVFADYDNDGLTDLFLATYDERVDRRPGTPGFSSCVCLFRNNGDLTFTNVTAEAGLAISGVAAYGMSAADVDNDGWVDLFVCNRGGYGELRDGGGLNILFHNRGDGTFEDVSAVSGLADVRRMTFQSGFLDYDRDGDQDLYLATDKLLGNELYRNDGNLRFTNVSEASGADIKMNGMCVAVGDYDNDLDPDVFITNTPDGHALLRNNGNGSFSNVATDAVVYSARIGWGARWMDVDNDGWLDLYVVHFAVPDNRNQLFRNRRNGTFEDISIGSGCENAVDGFGLAQADFNDDGAPDFVVTNKDDPCGLFLHEGTSLYSIRFKLIGVESNRDAIGARLLLHAGASVQMREIVAGDSYLSHSEMEVTFGLGGPPNRLEILWPSGLQQTVSGLQSRGRYRIVEGVGIQDGTLLEEHAVEARGPQVRLRWETVQWPSDQGFRVERAPVVGAQSADPVDLGRVSDQGRWHLFEDNVIGVSPGTYRYSVQVIHADGSETQLFQSQDVEIDPTPLTVGDFEVVANATGVHLSWRLPSSSLADVRDVHVQRARAPEGPWELVSPRALRPTAAMHFTDTAVQVGSRYWYRLLLEGSGASHAATIGIGVRVPGAAEKRAALVPPVEPRDGGPVRLGFSLGWRADVQLRLYDARGRHVRTLVQGARDPGVYSFTWDRSDAAGHRVARGLYFLDLRAGNASDTHKLLLLH
jgi:hypothetical protein